MFAAIQQCGRMSEPAWWLHTSAGSDHNAEADSIMAKGYVPYQGPVIKRAEALRLGISRYFIANPCPEGHIAQRQTKCGGCCECARIKCLARYHANSALGKERQKEWRAKNLEYDKARARQWKKDNPEKDIAAKKAWTERNKEHLRAKKREWSRANAEKLNEQRRAKPEERRERLRAWLSAHPGMGAIYARKRRARTRAVGGTHTVADIDEIYAAQSGRCAYCRKPLNGRFRVDHIVPVSTGGSNDRKNLQVTCQPCNNRKYNKRPEEFARIMGLLI